MSHAIQRIAQKFSVSPFSKGDDLGDFLKVAVQNRKKANREKRWRSHRKRSPNFSPKSEAPSAAKARLR